MSSFNWSIRSTLLAISLTMLALIVGLGALSYSRLYVVNQAASQIRDRWLPATRDLAEVARATESFRMLLSLELLATSDIERASEDFLLSRDLADRGKAWNSYLQNPLSEEQLRLADRIDAKWQEFLSQSDDVLVLMQQGDHDNAYAKFLESDAVFDDLRVVTAEGLQFNVAAGGEASDRAAAEYGTAQIWVSAAMALGLLVCSAMAIVAIFGVSRPILAVVETMKRLARQELATEIVGAQRGGEIGEMAKALVVFKTNAVQLRAAHEALEQSNALLESRVVERTRELEAAHDELLKKERLSAIGQITATVAHELRNPLSAIRNSIFVLKEHAAAHDAPANRPLARIERSIERCDAIVAELLDYTRNTALNLEPCEIDDWLRDLAPDLAQPVGGRIVLELNASQAHVEIDPGRFRRVAINLVDNAIQAMSETMESAPQVVIRTRALDDAVEIELEDNGPGISAENLSKVFEPLFSTKSFGTGLGLPTVRQIVEQHNGTIELKSTLGVGTSAVIRLPLSRVSIAA